MKDCFLGSAVRDLVTLSQPAALGVLLARKSKFVKRKCAKNNLQSAEKEGQMNGTPQDPFSFLIIIPRLH